MLNLILTRRSRLGSVKLTRKYQSAGCDTDHSLIQSRRFHPSKKEGRPCIDTSKIGYREKAEEFSQALEDALPGPPSTNVSERWEHLRDTIHNTAMSTFGKRQIRSAD